MKLLPGMTKTEVLSALAKQHASTVPDIADYLELSESIIRRHLRDLVQLGYVETVRSIKTRGRPRPKFEVTESGVKFLDALTLNTPIFNRRQVELLIGLNSRVRSLERKLKVMEAK